MNNISNNVIINKQELANTIFELQNNANALHLMRKLAELIQNKEYFIFIPGKPRETEITNWKQKFSLVAIGYPNEVIGICQKGLKSEDEQIQKLAKVILWSCVKNEGWLDLISTFVRTEFKKQEIQEKNPLIEYTYLELSNSFLLSPVNYTKKKNEILSNCSSVNEEVLVNNVYDPLIERAKGACHDACFFVQQNRNSMNSKTQFSILLILKSLTTNILCKDPKLIINLFDENLLKTMVSTDPLYSFEIFYSLLFGKFFIDEIIATTNAFIEGSISRVNPSDREIQQAKYLLSYAGKLKENPLANYGMPVHRASRNWGNYYTLRGV